VGVQSSEAGTLVRIGAGVGVPAAEDAADGDRLVREADEAMYRVKQTGKGRYQVPDGLPLSSAQI
jgi:GGDEF domain-containing protein